VQPATTKIVLCSLDGLGGLPRPATGKSELETARVPTLHALAARSACGLLRHVGPGITPGSGPGHLGLFGYDPLRYPVGRGVLEALGIDFELRAGDVAARGNFCTVDARGNITETRTVAKTGSGLADIVTTAGFDANAQLVGNVGYYDTDLTITGGDKLSQVALGVLVRIDDEYMRLDGLDISAGTITVARGCADTIPQLHLDKARIWFQTAFPTGDYRDYAEGEIVGVRLISRTSSQTLDPIFAYEDFITMGSRQGRPYPPGDMKVNGTGFGDGPFVTTGDVDFTWAYRDRILQSNVLFEHEAASIGPEAGTTYNVYVYDYDGVTLLRTASTGGTSYSYAAGDAVTDGDATILRLDVHVARS